MKPAPPPSEPVQCPCSFRRDKCPICGGEGRITAEKWMEIEEARKGKKK